MPLNFELKIFGCGGLTFNWLYFVSSVSLLFSSVAMQLNYHTAFICQALHQAFPFSALPAHVLPLRNNLGNILGVILDAPKYKHVPW